MYYSMLDQHFMVDEKVIKNIVDYAVLEKSDIVLEIGSGPGALTKELKKKCSVVTIEIDPKFSADIQGNALKVKFPKFNKIVSNLPYSICEALFWRLIRHDFENCVLTVPKSFFTKLGGSGKLGLVTWYCFDASFGFDVDRDAFDPVPKTDSCVFSLAPKKSKLKELFKQYDKKLLNALIEYFCLNGLSKKEAKHKVACLKIPVGVLSRKVLNLSFEELKKVVKKLEG